MRKYGPADADAKPSVALGATRLGKTNSIDSISRKPTVALAALQRCVAAGLRSTTARTIAWPARTGTSDAEDQ
jgi:hypothetical protein